MYVSVDTAAAHDDGGDDSNCYVVSCDDVDARLIPLFPRVFPRASSPRRLSSLVFLQTPDKPIVRAFELALVVSPVISGSGVPANSVSVTIALVSLIGHRATT